MRKIPTLFKRDPDNMSRVLNQVHPDCEWVLQGEGVATRKYDGTCVMLDEYGWWARREVKSGKPTPAGWYLVELDTVTRKAVGWEPIGNSPFAKFHAEALQNYEFVPGTYELCGPKINGNPENYAQHTLKSHEHADALFGVPRDFQGLERFLTSGHFIHEGIVWHHPDGRMAKLKRRDFGA